MKKTTDIIRSGSFARSPKLLGRIFALAATLSCGAALAQTQTNTYVDAVSGVSGNTTLADGSTFTPPLNGTTGLDNNWEERTPFASGGNVFETAGEGPAVAENGPEIRTTITGLTPGKRYRVYVHFWDGNGTVENWSVRAGLTANPGTNTLFTHTDATNTFGATAAPLASTFTYATAPTLFTEGNRTMLAGLVGTVLVNGSGQIAVFIDDRPAATSVNLRTWYDGLSYAEAIDPLVGATVLTPPTVPIGGSTLVTAGVSGTAPFSFQWLSNGVPILNATNQSLTLTNLQLASSGSSYSLVVSNFPFGVPAVVTNTAATLTVRAPIDLTWLGSVGAEWNTTDVNWDSNADLTADVAYTDGDRVQFNDAGAQYFLTVLTNYYPSRVIVSNEFSEYTLVGPGVLAGSGPLIKQGAAGLTLGTDSGHAGGTLIANGTLTVGVGLGAGSVGTGPVTNNGALVINRTGTLAIPGNISGTGGITINTAGANTVGNVILSGANSYSGAVVVAGGTLTLGNSSALGNSPSVTVNSTTAGANGGTRVTLDGGISIPSGKELILNTTFDTARTMVFGTGLGVFTNTWNGPVTINGDGTAQFGSAPNGTLILNGNVTGPSTSIFISRGSGANLVVNGTLNLGSVARVQTADGSGIQINSTGNSWATNMFANAGRWTIGANNAIPVGSVFIQQGSDSGTLDLNGFNQQILGLDAGVQILITNSSALVDSTFTFAGGTSTFGGVFSDATRKLNLAVTSGTLVLTNGGSVKLPNSTVTIASGAVMQLDFSATNAVGELVLNGVPQGPGLYSAANRAPFLAGAGALVVLSPNPTNLAYSVAGGTIALTWPGSHLGWLVQSNSVDVANAVLWFDIAGSQGATNLNIPISPAQSQVFFRMRHP